MADRPENNEQKAASTDHVQRLADAAIPRPGEQIPTFTTRPERHDDLGPDQKLEMTNPFTSEKPKTKESEWLVIANLTDSPEMSRKDKDGPPNQTGGLYKLEELKKLAGETKDKPVTIVAQVVKQDHENPDAPAVLERYRIKDGKVERLPDASSTNPGDNLQHLISDSLRDNPAQKVALWNQGHGGGTRGLKGEDGKMTVDQFTDAVRDGLKGTGHDHLDVVNFDSCLMSQDNVAYRLKQAGVTDHVVASEEMTLTRSFNGASPDVDSENVAPPIHDLLQNPKMDGNAFANTIVDSAKHGNNTTSEPAQMNVEARSGTVTLAHLDLRSSDELKAAVDHLGADLTKVTATPEGRDVVEKLIEETKHLGEAGTRDGIQNRDLKQFAKKLEEAIESGKIKDEDGKLRTDARAVEDAVSHVVASNYGAEGEQGYQNLGGVSIFLPADNYRNTVEQAATQMPIAEFARFSGALADQANQHKDEPIAPIVNSVKSYVMMLDRVDAPNNAQLAALRKEVNDLDPNGPQDKLHEQVTHIAEMARELTKADFAREQVQVEAARVRKQNLDQLALQATQEPAGWNRFIESLGPVR